MNSPATEAIRAARQAAGLTQTQAAELVHVALRTWQRWESDKVGENKPMPAAAWELFLIKTEQRGDEPLIFIDQNSENAGLLIESETPTFKGAPD